MRTFRIVCLLLISFAVPFLSSAQSLGSVAKKERERRDKNKKEGVEAREISEEEVFGERPETEAEEPAEEAVSGEETEGIDSPPDSSREEPAIPGVKPTPPETADPDRESRERKRKEAEWRSKASQARARIAEARERVQVFEELVLGPNERYVDEQGNTLVESAEQLQRLTREAKEELAAAEADWKRIQEDARRSGIPPGWIR
jgi:hypothetical protein